MENWEDVLSSLLLTQAVELKINIDREERNINLVIESDKLRELSQKGLFLPMAFSRPLVTSVMENSPAKDAGLQDGDVLVNIDKTEVLTAKDVIAIVTKNKAKQIPIVAVRDADTMNFVVKTSVDGLIGIGLSEIYTGEVYYKTYGFFDSITQSFVNISDYTKLTFTMLGRVIQGEIAFESAFGGPVKIAKFAAKSAENGFSTFLYFLAALSLSLAIINIFPFPGLDGGHLVIVVIEAIIRRELPLKAKIVIQNIGFFALLALMAYIIYIDIISM
jgi:regulator of sigma E protease